jgi:hypothetical protein
VYRGLKSAAYPPAPERRLSGMKDSCLDWVSTCVFLVDEEVVNALARAVAQLSLQPTLCLATTTMSPRGPSSGMWWSRRDAPPCLRSRSRQRPCPKTCNPRYPWKTL